MIVFVFGTLKQGFALHDRGLSGVPFLGLARTFERYPMLVAGPWYAPMMVNQPGIGFHVRGELYGPSCRSLQLLDHLQSVGKPGNYQVLIRVLAERAAAPLYAQAYMKAAALADPRHTAFLEQYEDDRFVPPWERRVEFRNGTWAQRSRKDW